MYQSQKDVCYKRQKRVTIILYIWFIFRQSTINFTSFVKFILLIRNIIKYEFIHKQLLAMLRERVFFWCSVNVLDISILCDSLTICQAIFAFISRCFLSKKVTLWEKKWWTSKVLIFEVVRLKYLAHRIGKSFVKSPIRANCCLLVNRLHNWKHQF